MNRVNDLVLLGMFVFVMGFMAVFVLGILYVSVGWILTVRFALGFFILVGGCILIGEKLERWL